MPIDFSLVRLGERYDRPALARMWGYKGFEAISRGVVIQKNNRSIVLFVTRIKQRSSTLYNDYLSGDHLFWEGEEGHGSDNRIASASTSGEFVHLFYREIHHTSFEYKGPIVLLEFYPETDRPSRFVFGLLHDLSPWDDLRMHAEDINAATQTERTALVKARIGQGEFRKALLEKWGSKCSVTGVFLPSILRASHIKPWRLSTNRERLDPYNGLLLLPQYDALFDAGLITFSETGSMLPSKALGGALLSLLGVDSKCPLRFVHEAHRKYLTYHRDHVFA